MGEQRVTTIQGQESGTAGKKAKKVKKQVPRVRIFIKSTYNNTIISITDLNGNIVGWGSAGRTGFKGSRKSTPYAAQRTMEDLMQRLKNYGIKEADIVVKGVGIGRDSAIRALSQFGIEALSIKDKTPVPHGGVRPKKARRV